jgi:hypothetical protein
LLGADLAGLAVVLAETPDGLIRFQTHTVDTQRFRCAISDARLGGCPEPTGSGRATPTSHFQHRPGHARSSVILLACDFVRGDGGATH